MANVIQFPVKATDAEPAIDLLTAVDVAIRDLRDISQRWGEEGARVQADECRRMLEEVYKTATAEGEFT